ncbi:MAG: mechanosensitive ion channel domain-containing protein, partial [bacterium]
WNLWLFVASLTGIRLLLAPSFLARFVLSRDVCAGLRTAWGTVTVICLIAAALALAPVFLSLDNLARMVSGTVWDCLSAVAAAFAVLWVIELLLRRAGVQGRLLAFFNYVLRAVIIACVFVSVGFFWWGLANDVVLSPDAPDFIRQAVDALAASWSVFLRGWGYDLGSGMTAGRLVWGLMCFIASFWVASITKKLFNDHLLSRTPMDETTRLTFSTVLGYMIVVTGFLVGLNVAGSSLKNLALLAGAITVGLGFGLQNVVNNFVSSLMIHFSRTIRVGDYIEVAGSRGKVADIGFRNTRITTDDGVTVLVPNGAFVGGNIVNWTNPRRQTRLHVPVTVLRQADTAVVMRLLVDIAAAHKAILQTPHPAVEIKSVTVDKIGMDLLAWTGTPEAISGTIGDLSLEIDKTLREKNLLA